MTTVLMMGTMAVYADETVTVSATNSDISQGLDLRVVAKLFAEAKNLEQFESMLNNPDSAFNNLDLNGDGVVDYLRVVETGEGNSRLIVLQAILAKDIYQDVASIVVKKDEQTSQVSVEIVGDEYVYGTKYVIVPTYYYRPYLYDWFWGPHYVYWNSPYYWDFYPRWWYSWHPYAYDWYWNRCHYYCSYRPICSYRHTHEVSRYANEAMYARSAERQMGAAQFAAQRASRSQSPTAVARPALERSPNAVVAARSVQPAAQRAGAPATATAAATRSAQSAASTRATQPMATARSAAPVTARTPAAAKETKVSTRTFGSSNIAATRAAATPASVQQHRSVANTDVTPATSATVQRTGSAATKSRTGTSYTAPSRNTYTSGNITTRSTVNTDASHSSYSTVNHSSYSTGSHSSYSGGSRGSYSTGGGGLSGGGGGFSGGSAGGRSSVSAGSRR